MHDDFFAIAPGQIGRPRIFLAAGTDHGAIFGAEGGFHFADRIRLVGDTLHHQVAAALILFGERQQIFRTGLFRWREALREQFELIEPVHIRC